MARRKRLAAIAIALAAILTFVVGPASAGGPGKWTKLSLTSQKADGFDLPSAVRTADGKLHVVYEIKPTATLHNIRWVTLSQAGKTLASGNVLPSNWVAIDPELVLLPDGSGGLRVVFIGNQDTNGANFFARGPIYTATSPNGQTWTLQNVTLGQHTVLNGDFGAAAELNGTPVTAFGLNAHDLLPRGDRRHGPRHRTRRVDRAGVDDRQRGRGPRDEQRRVGLAGVVALDGRRHPGLLRRADPAEPGVAAEGAELGEQGPAQQPDAAGGAGRPQGRWRLHGVLLADRRRSRAHTSASGRWARRRRRRCPERPAGTRGW